MIEKALYAWLTDASNGVTPHLATRIHPVKAPKSADHPYLVYQKISEESPKVLSTCRRTGTVTTRIQCKIVGESSDTVNDAASAIIGTEDAQQLDGFSGTITWDGGGKSLEVCHCRAEGLQDGGESPQHAEDLGLYWVMFDLIFVWKE